jgi:hypothetical protein
MSLRLIIAGIVGGIVMFLWSGLAHNVLGLGSMGMSAMSQEEPARAALKADTGDKDGFYLFPFMDEHAKDKGAAMKAWEAKTHTGPSGLVLYHPAGRSPEMGVPTLAEEGLKEVVVSLLAAFMLTLTTLTRFWSRAGFVALVGLTATLTTNPSYLIWYGFPASYTLGYMLTEFLGYLLAGLAIAALLRPRLRVEI